MYERKTTDCAECGKRVKKDICMCKTDNGLICMDCHAAIYIRKSKSSRFNG